MKENWQLSNLIEEAEKDTEYGVDYHKKVKDRCFLCGTTCNKDLSFEYYCRLGNCCMTCSGKVGRKVNNKTRLEKMEKWFKGIIKENTP